MDDNRSRGPRLHEEIDCNAPFGLDAPLAPAKRATYPAAVIARLVAIDGGGSPTIMLDGEALRARTTVALVAAQVGREVALLFESGRDDRPIVIGVLGAEHAEKQVAVSVDGSRLVLSADREITLKCGPATLTLTSDGSVEIRGHRLLSRSTGMNRIMGASVKIN
jgi:hypothetical protein